MKKLLSTVLIMSFILSLASCSAKVPVSTTANNNQNAETSTQPVVSNPNDNVPSNAPLKSLYDKEYLSDLDSYWQYKERQILPGSSIYADFVLSEADRVVKDSFETCQLKAKSYELFGVYLIDIGDPGWGGTYARIYRIEYGFIPENYTQLIYPQYSHYVYDDTYFRHTAIKFIVVAYDENGAEIVRHITDNEIRKDYMTEEMMSTYRSPYSAAATELLKWHLTIKNMVHEEPNYAELYGKEENIETVKNTLFKYYDETAEIGDISFDSYVRYDESFYAAFRVSIKQNDSSDFEEWYYVLSFDLSDDSEIFLAEIPPSEFASCDAEIVKRGMNLMHQDASIRIDPYGYPYGPGSNALFFGFPVAEEPVITQQDWEPIWSFGSYWYTVGYKGFNAVCYHDADTNREVVYEIETSRTDVCAYRGIRVGDSVEKMLEAYPELKLLDKNIHPDEYTGDIYYFDPFTPDDSEYNYGMNVVFYCDNSVVSKVRITYIFC